MGINNTPPSGGNSGCPGIQLNNDEWYAFAAGSTSITFTILTSNCQNGDGLQAVIRGNCGDSEALACNPGCPGCGDVPVVITYDNFTVGQVYYLMIDGWVADVCDFTIEVTDGNVTPPPPDPATEPQGPTVVCPGAVAEYTIPAVYAAGNYIWTAPPGSSINGFGSSLNINGPGGTTVTITFGNAGGNICVTPDNPCNPPGAGACLAVSNSSNPINVLDTVTICDNEFYVFNGDTLHESGVYTAILTNEYGCEANVELTLTVLDTLASSFADTICANEIYIFHGDTLSAAGNYTALLTGENGCDSTVVLSLTVLPTQSSSLEVTICAGETYVFYGDTLSEAGDYTALLTAENGCDSVETLILTVLPEIPPTNISDSFCDGSTYDFHGTTLSEEGTYTAVLASELGCDSTVVLTLTVYPEIPPTNISASICAGETYEFQGTTLSDEGTYTATLSAQSGCDSTVVLTLTVFPEIPPVNISASICNGEIYVFNGEALTVGGSYTAKLSSQFGCDSTVVLNLTVNAAPQVNISASICEGEVYEFNLEFLSVAGTYVAFLQTTEGCDSTMILDLSVTTLNTDVSAQGSTLTAQNGYQGYQWINCDTGAAIEGATDSVYTTSITGNYAVEVTQNNCTATSTCVFVQVVSTYEPLDQNEWFLQPNPTSSRTMVVFQEDTQAELWLEIHDVAGRRLYSQNVPQGVRQIALDLGTLPDGLLMVRLANERGVSAKRLMKAK